MRITKQIATDVAKQLIAEKQKEIDDLKKELNHKAYELYVVTIPEGLLKQFKKYPDFFYSNKSFYLSGIGLNHKNVSFDVYMPRKSQTMLVDDVNAKWFELAFNVIEQKQKELGDFKIQIEIALFNLRTYNNVEKQFPEAFKFLPPKQTSAVMINIKDIRCKLDKANC